MIFAAGILALVLTAAACAALLYASRNRNASGQAQRKIGAVYMTMNNPYFEVINEEIKNVVTGRGDVMITRDSALDAGTQNRQIKELVQEGVDALIVNPVDWQDVDEGLGAAREAGIPVLVVDAEIHDAAYADAMIYSDNAAAGRMCALHLMEKRDSGKILLLVQSTNKSALDRIESFRETLDAADWPYEIVGELECYGQLEIAQPLTEEFLQERQDVDVVMALNDPSALGAMAALDAAGLLEGTLVYSVDGAPEAKQMIAEGKMTATAAQFPTETGEEAARILYDLLEGKSVEKKTVMSVELVSSENIDRYSLTGWQ